MYKILIVDDEEKIRTVIRKYAEFEGFDADEAENGIVAVDMVKRKEYALVILDIMMPELDGISVCKKIREHSNVPVIMLSARG